MTTFRVVDQPHGSTTVGAELQAAFADPAWTTFRCAVAFAKTSGVRHIARPLHEFAGRTGTTTRVSIGISSRGTSLEGLQDLWRLLHKRGELFVYHEGTGLPASFHPKVYLFERADKALVISGSNNLTEGGLFVNHELSTVVELDPTLNPADASYLASIRAALDRWQTAGPACKPVDANSLQLLYARGDLPSEASMTIARRARNSISNGPGSASGQNANPFGSSGVAKAPAPSSYPSGLPAAPVIPAPPIAMAGVPIQASGSSSGSSSSSPSTSAASPTPPTTLQTLFMEVRPHQNGEFFLSYRAVAEDPSFFGHPFTGWGTPKTVTARPYPMATPDPVVDIAIFDAAGNKLHEKRAHPLNLVDYELKHEIRATLPDGLQRDVPAMSVLVMTKNPNPSTDYRLEFHPPGSPGASAADIRLTNSLPSGGPGVGRRYGWS